MTNPIRFLFDRTGRRNRPLLGGVRATAQSASDKRSLV